MTIVLPETPTPAATAAAIESLRRAEVLGDTYADYGRLVEGLQDETEVYDRLESVGRFVAASFDASRWWAADYLLFGEGVLGERFYQLSELLGLAESTLVDYARVAGRVARSRRRPELHFSHHRVVARLSPEQQAYWLAQAVERDLSTRELADAISAAEPAEEGGGDEPDSVVDTVRVDRPLLATIVNHSRTTDDPEWVLIPASVIPRVRALLGEEER